MAKKNTPPLEIIPEVPHAERQEGWPERIALWCAMLATVGMLVLITAGLISRNLFSYSFDFVDEYSGYLLVSAFFLSTAACQTTDNFHRIEIFRSRLSDSARELSDLVLYVVTLLACLVLLWFLVRFGWLTWVRNEVANTMMGTPLWIPRFAMPLGTALLCYALVVSIARLVVGRAMRLKNASPRSEGS